VPILLLIFVSSMYAGTERVRSIAALKRLQAHGKSHSDTVLPALGTTCALIIVHFLSALLSAAI